MWGRMGWELPKEVQISSRSSGLGLRELLLSGGRRGISTQMGEDWRRDLQPGVGDELPDPGSWWLGTEIRAERV